MHVAVIPDGNRRFEKKTGLPGHQGGSKKIAELVRWFTECDTVKTLTVYGFSEENWSRQGKEVLLISEIITKALDILASPGSPEFLKTVSDSCVFHVNICCTDESNFSPNTVAAILKIKKMYTSEHQATKILNLCIGYSGRSEIIAAVLSAAKDGARPTEADVLDHLTVKSSPDIVIRTSGEKRLSNFLLWQIGYSELYFIESLWPEVDIELEIGACVKDFSEGGRTRRFGA